MYAPGTGRKWCLMNVLMYLWLFVLGLCVLLCGQGAGVLAMHLQTPPPSPAAVAVVPNFVVFGGSPRSWRKNSPLSSPVSSSRAAEARDPHVPHNLFSLSSSSNLNASDLDKPPHSQLENVWYRIWRRRRHMETLRMRRRLPQQQKQRLLHSAENLEVHDTRPKKEDDEQAITSGLDRTKRDSRFGRYPVRMFKPSQASSSTSQGKVNLHPKFFPPSPPMPSAVASPSLTSARQRLGFEQQHSSRQYAAGSGHESSSSPPMSPTSSHNTMLIKPKDQHGLPGSSASVPNLHSTPAVGSSISTAEGAHHRNDNIHQHQHNNNGHNTNNSSQQQHHPHLHQGQVGMGHRGLLQQMKGRKYCSARDPANLAFEAGVVFEGRVRSMSTHNYSVTFQVLKVHKAQPGFLQVPSHIRIHFKQVKNLECDLHRENFRNPAHIRGRLDQGKVYFIFGRFVELNNFTLIGQPMRSSEKHQREVRNGLSETYGQTASIEKMLVKGRPGRPVKLICKVNGRPPPTVTWYKGSQLITRNRIKYKLVHRKRQSQLIIRTYDSSDSGVYQCQAKNRLTKQAANATIRVDFSHYLNGATTSITSSSPSSSALPTRTSLQSPDSRTSGGSVTDEDVPPIGAEECPPEQKERYCMNGGKCVYFSSVREFSCRCADGFGGERCDMKTPTTYNHSSTVSYGFRFRSTANHFSLDDSREADEEDYAM